MKTIALVGTFDSKGKEFQFAKTLIEKIGFKTFTIHAGTFAPLFEPDISNEEVAQAGGMPLADVVDSGDRGLAADVMAKGVAVIVPRLYEEGRYDGILSFGGSGGTTLATAGMRELPVGVPKVMVSTMASGNVSEYVGTSDIVMMPSLVDVAGLNKIIRTVIRNAVMAVAGMVGYADSLPEETGDASDTKPAIAATMFGVTTPCVSHAKELLEKAGYQVIVFHANGAGGKMMEKLIDQGMFSGVLDLTTTEVCDDLFGGVLTAGPHRCEAAIRQKLPQVVSVGADEMINFGHISTLPQQYAGRNIHIHNPANTLVRMTAKESAKLGRRLAEKWNTAQTEMTVLLPLGGMSMLDAPERPFDGPEERKALYSAIKEGITNPKVHVRELSYNINDQAFAEEAVDELLDLIKVFP